jgi:hypothetical protein
MENVVVGYLYQAINICCRTPFFIKPSFIQLSLEQSEMPDCDSTFPDLDDMTPFTCAPRKPNGDGRYAGILEEALRHRS